jgi:thiamine biosynthesis lipoprotein
MCSQGGVRFGQVLDPRSGRPVQGALLAAVVTDSPTDADALSTALLTLGEAGLPRIEQQWPGYRDYEITAKRGRTRSR